MRWNATFRYQKASTPTRNADGLLTKPTATGFEPGTICQVERSAPAQHRIGADGQEFVYSHTVYTLPKYGRILEVGDLLEIRFIDGNTFTKTILGTDITDKKVLAIWV
ncbi:MAG: hypothetical protein IJR84_09200 [Bacteroidaceae bacterium]|nr:hypothetical protein [Bacteroidaceae bacterium]